MLKSLIKKYLYVVIIEIRFSYMIFCCIILKVFNNLCFTHNFAFLLFIKIHTITIFELDLNWIIPLSRFPWFRSWETPSLFKFKTLTHVTSHYTLPGFFLPCITLVSHQCFHKGLRPSARNTTALHSEFKTYCLD